jgi:hypothetical protein
VDRRPLGSFATLKLSKATADPSRVAQDDSAVGRAERRRTGIVVVSSPIEKFRLTHAAALCQGFVLICVGSVCVWVIPVIYAVAKSIIYAFSMPAFVVPFQNMPHRDSRYPRSQSRDLGGTNPDNTQASSSFPTL